MLSLSNISVYFGASPLFSGINLQVNPKERIALAGRNGSGKTTLLNIIAGKLSPTEGEISYRNDLSIGYLPQHLLTKDLLTVREEALSVFSKEAEISQRVKELTKELSAREDYESTEYMEIVQQLTNATDLLSLFSPEKQMQEVERTLKGLGFRQKDLDRPTSEFSGGWRMRIELAKILLSHPDLLLMDEPTNHLDMESIMWLEEFIKHSSAAVIMVSHDRKFLDETTTRTVELSLGKAHDYRTSYSHYLDLREERYEQQRRAYVNQQKEIKRTENFIERFRYKSTKAVQVQSRVKSLERLDMIEIEEVDRRKIQFRFPTEVASGSYPLIVEDLSVRYGSRLVLDRINLTIKRGEKVALVGKNGSGKTTFLRSIMNQIPYEGSIRVGHQVSISYFAQNQASLLDSAKTIWETVDEAAVGDIRLKLHDILGAFMFGGEAEEKPVHVLSGGERSRLAMILLLLSPSNVLILDEPTNHLDIPSKEVLKEAISHYDGTVLLVSHDRSFLEGLADRVIEFSDRRIINHQGGLPHYLQTLCERSKPTASSTAVRVEKDIQENTGRMDYERQKEIQRRQRKLTQSIEEAEAQIEKLEGEKLELEQRLSSCTPSPCDISRYGEVTQALQSLLQEWESLHHRLDEATL